MPPVAVSGTGRVGSGTNFARLTDTVAAPAMTNARDRMYAAKPIRRASSHGDLDDHQPFGGDTSLVGPTVVPVGAATTAMSPASDTGGDATTRDPDQSDAIGSTRMPGPKRRGRQPSAVNSCTIRPR